jgi:predicted nucleotidyltransferase
MVVTPAQRRIWRQRRQAAHAAAQAREQAAHHLAARAASLLRHHWPRIEGVWLFGSVAEGRTHAGSDLDLAVAGLPPEALLTAKAELDGLAAEAVDTAREVIPIDLVPLESLPPRWQQGIRERAIAL